MPLFMKMSAYCHRTHLKNCVYVLDELPEEACSAVNHTCSLRLLGLGAGHS